MGSWRSAGLIRKSRRSFSAATGITAGGGWGPGSGVGSAGFGLGITAMRHGATGTGGAWRDGGASMAGGAGCGARETGAAWAVGAEVGEGWVVCTMDRAGERSTASACGDRRAGAFGTENVQPLDHVPAEVGASIARDHLAPRRDVPYGAPRKHHGDMSCNKHPAIVRISLVRYGNLPDVDVYRIGNALSETH